MSSQLSSSCQGRRYGPLHHGTKHSCRAPLPLLSQAGRRARPAPHDNASSLCYTQGVRWAAQHVFQVRNTQFHSFVIVVRKAQLRSVSKFVSALALCAMPQLRILPLRTITVKKKNFSKLSAVGDDPPPPHMYSDGAGGIKGAGFFLRTDFRKVGKELSWEAPPSPAAQTSTD
jgi:hypothetical protein